MTSITDTALPPIPVHERANRILHEPRLLALLLAGGVMATIVVVAVGFSSALYTVSSGNPGSTVGAGEIKLNFSNPGELVDGTNLQPGVVRASTVTVTNVAQRAEVTLKAANLTETPASGPFLADILYVKVTETSPTTVIRFNGRLRTLVGNPVALGTFNAGEIRDFHIEITWPKAEDSLTYANSNTTFDFAWKAVSTE